jgi:hypothetical protein
MPGRAGRWDGSLTRRPARRPSGVAVWGFCKSLFRLAERILRDVDPFDADIALQLEYLANTAKQETM